MIHVHRSYFTQCHPFAVYSVRQGSRLYHNACLNGFSIYDDPYPISWKLRKIHGKSGAFPFEEFKMDKVQEIDDDFQSPHPQDTDAETGPETGPENLDFLQFHFLGKCECEGR